MAERQTGKDIETQYHIDRWADLMKRIIKNPEIADRIPNHANLLFAEGDVIFINGEPMRFSELVRPESRQQKNGRKKKDRKSKWIRSVFFPPSVSSPSIAFSF